MKSMLMSSRIHSGMLSGCNSHAGLDLPAGIIL
jgi:hypothetical protein